MRIAPKSINPTRKTVKSIGQVVIVANADVPEKGKPIQRSPVTDKMVMAVKKAILANSSSDRKIEVVSPYSLALKRGNEEKEETNIIYCPLTIELPQWLTFPAQKIFQDCRDIQGTRAWVEKNLGYKTNKENSWLGDLWLPIVLTKKQRFYGGVIEEGIMPNFYSQPVNLSDNLRRKLYCLAEVLLDNLSAPPSVYLLQFSVQQQEIIFDRLWPFPAAPALASLNVQSPDLFTCYWCCLSEENVADFVSI